MPGTSGIEMLVGWGVMPLALVLNPWILVRCMCRGVGRERLPLVVAVVSLTLQPLIALAFHLLGVPIAPLPLAVFHLLLTAIGSCVLWIAGRPLRSDAGQWPVGQLWLFLILCILVFPFTHLGGIDAYKWGDLATSVAVEREVPWLVHPLALLGFTPRSYPSLHPLLMGSIRALGGTSLDSAFFLASLVMCGVGVTGAAYLGERLGLSKRAALLLAAFYTLSPVFIRYVHWGTGRGAFLAVLPLFVAALLDLPRRGSWILALFSGLLLVLAHKTGLICVVVLPLARMASLLYPRRHPVACLALLVLSFAVSVLFAPARYVGAPVGMVLGWVRYDLARFAWASPAVVLAAIAAPRELFRPSESRFMWTALLITFPVAHHMEMYPAMIALPFIVYAGLGALRALQAVLPGVPDQHVRVALLLSLAGALAIVIQRSVEAMPRRVYLAARYIEQVDPYGPFELISPWRSRIQGVVTGCPRFSVGRDAGSGLSIKAPPKLTVDPRRLVREWAGYIRGLVRTGAAADWYGSAQRRYHVLPDTAPAPLNAERIYRRDGVSVYRETLATP